MPHALGKLTFRPREFWDWTEATTIAARGQRKSGRQEREADGRSRLRHITPAVCPCLLPSDSRPLAHGVESLYATADFAGTVIFTEPDAKAGRSFAASRGSRREPSRASRQEAGSVISFGPAARLMAPTTGSA